MTDAHPLLIACGSHGSRVSAVVCRHMFGADRPPVGFVENSDDPNDLQAWCAMCEAKFEAEGGMTDAFREFNDMALVCVVCYTEKKQLHMIHSDGACNAL